MNVPLILLTKHRCPLVDTTEKLYSSIENVLNILKGGKFHLKKGYLIYLYSYDTLCSVDKTICSFLQNIQIPLSSPHFLF